VKVLNFPWDSLLLFRQTQPFPKIRTIETQASINCYNNTNSVNLHTLRNLNEHNEDVKFKPIKANTCTSVDICEELFISLI